MIIDKAKAKYFPDPVLQINKINTPINISALHDISCKNVRIACRIDRGGDAHVCKTRGKFFGILFSVTMPIAVTRISTVLTVIIGFELERV